MIKCIHEVLLKICKDVKSDKRRAQIQVARTVLEKYTMLLLTASKTYLRHPDCESARQTRDGVFRRMRSALQLIGLCVCDGILPFDPSRYFTGNAPNLPGSSLLPVLYPDEEPLDIGLQLTANVAIRQLLDISALDPSIVPGPDTGSRYGVEWLDKTASTSGFVSH